MCECGLTATTVAGSASLVLLVVYVAVAAFTFCRFDDNNFIRQLYRLAPLPERTMLWAALTWPLWVWWKEECEW